MRPRRAAARSRDGRERGGGAVPADDLAVAGLSGRRVLLFQRHRMGGGSRRYRRCRVLAGLAGRDARGWTRILRRRVSGPRAPRRGVARRGSGSARDIAELAAAFVPSRERQLETSAQGRAFIDIARAAWNCDGLEQRSRLATAPSSIRSRSAWSAPRMRFRSRPTLHAFLHALASNWISAGARLIPLGQTDSQRVLARLEPVVVATAAARARRLARRSRQRDLSRRSRQPAPRDAVYEVVPVMRMCLHLHRRRPGERRDPYAAAHRERDDG